MLLPLLVFLGSSAGKESACKARHPGLTPGSGRSTGEGISYPFQYSWASLMAQLVKNPPAMRETWVWYLGWGDPLEKGKATHSSILAWRIPWIYSPWGHKKSDTTEQLSLWISSTEVELITQFMTHFPHRSLQGPLWFQVCVCVFTFVLISCFHSPTFATCFSQFSYYVEYTCVNLGACVLKHTNTSTHPHVPSLQRSWHWLQKSISKFSPVKAPWVGGPEVGTGSRLSRGVLGLVLPGPSTCDTSRPCPLSLAVFLWNSGLLWIPGSLPDAG